MKASTPTPKLADRSATTYQIVTCLHGCGLRFPAAGGSDVRKSCPRCDGPIAVTDHRAAMNAPAGALTTNDLGPKIGVLVDNVRSLFNIGSIFRCADGANVSHIYLCGISATPDHAKLSKTALGSEQSVSWSYHTNAIPVASTLVEQGYALWALDTNIESESLFDVGDPLRGAQIVLAVGNELTGLDPLLFPLCERTIRIPMSGQKQSLNVAIALGIALYWMRGQPRIHR